MVGEDVEIFTLSVYVLLCNNLAARMLLIKIKFFSLHFFSHFKRFHSSVLLNR